jgi:hypothetical protein
MFINWLRSFFAARRGTGIHGSAQEARADQFRTIADTPLKAKPATWQIKLCGAPADLAHLLSPIVAALAMSLSSVSFIGNAAPSASALPMCGSDQTPHTLGWCNAASSSSMEIHMYIGGGILGLLLVIALVIYIMRRA